MNYRFLILLISIMLASCSESKYAKLVKTEMAKNVANDSLMFGMKFGLTKQGFYDQCWKLNNEGKILQGPSNEFVQYNLSIKKEESSIQDIKMLFYGIFNEEQIMTGMDMRFSYVSWSLWNESLHADKLVPVIKDSLISWYPGNGFIKVITKKAKKEIFVKIDGNRRIIIEPLGNNQEVNARIDDLKYVLE